MPTAVPYFQLLRGAQFDSRQPHVVPGSVRNTDHYVSSSGTAAWGDSINIGNPCSLTTAFLYARPGDTIWVQADGTYSFATSANPSNDGTNLSPIRWIGYGTTPGDGYLGRTNNNGALITTNMPLFSSSNSAVSISFGLQGGASTGGHIIENFQFSGITNSVNGGVCKLNDLCVLKSCAVTNTASGGANNQSLFVNGNYCMIDDCDIILSGTGGISAISTSGTSSTVTGCRIKGGPATGLRHISTAAITGCVIYGSNVGFLMNSTNSWFSLSNCTITGNTSHGIQLATNTTVRPSIINCMITDNGGYGLNMATTSTRATLFNNRFRDNTLGNIGNGGDWIAITNYNTVTSGSGTSDYVNAAGNDYRLIATSPAVGTGFFPYFDIGALQRQEEPTGGVFGG